MPTVSCTGRYPMASCLHTKEPSHLKSYRCCMGDCNISSRRPAWRRGTQCLCFEFIASKCLHASSTQHRAADPEGICHSQQYLYSHHEPTTIHQCLLLGRWSTTGSEETWADSGISGISDPEDGATNRGGRQMQPITPVMWGLKRKMAGLVRPGWLVDHGLMDS